MWWGEISDETDQDVASRSEVVVLIGEGHGRGLREVLRELLLVRLVDDELRWLERRLLHELKVCVPGERFFSSGDRSKIARDGRRTKLPKKKSER